MSEAPDVAEIESMLTDCETCESVLNDWERTFIDSLREQFDRKRSLTPSQYEKLYQIWETKT